MKTATKPTLSLTGILVEDVEQKGFTAWFAEFPEAVAEGDSEEEAKQNLFESLKNILEAKKEEEHINEHPEGLLYKKTSFDFELA